MQLDHFLTRSILTRLEISIIVSLGFFRPFVCGFFSILGNLLRGIMLTCCKQFLPHSCTLPRNILLIKRTSQRGKPKITSTLHILFLNCSIFAIETGLPTCVQWHTKLIDCCCSFPTHCNGRYWGSRQAVAPLHNCPVLYVTFRLLSSRNVKWCV